MYSVTVETLRSGSNEFFEDIYDDISGVEGIVPQTVIAMLEKVVVGVQEVGRI